MDYLYQGKVWLYLIFFTKLLKIKVILYIYLIEIVYVGIM